jgi:prepilin-type N-terminal cleavage/methylation domain-containing protein
MLALKKKGFTLIEIVIVLAIAALILVIVFLAVGGAQRSQRDTASQDGAAKMIAAHGQVVADNPTTTVAVLNTAGTWTGTGLGVNYIKGITDGRGNVPVPGTGLADASTKFYYQAGGTCNTTTGAIVAGTGLNQVAVAYYSEAKKGSVCKSNE